MTNTILMSLVDFFSAKYHKSRHFVLKKNAADKKTHEGRKEYVVSS